MIKKLIILLSIIYTPFILILGADWLMPYQNSQNVIQECNIKLPLKITWKKAPLELGISSPVYMNKKLYIFNLEESIWGILRGFSTIYINEIDIEKGIVKKKYFVSKVKNYKYIRMIGYDGKCYISVIWRKEESDVHELYIYLWAFDTQRGKVIWQWSSGCIDEYPLADSENIGAWMNTYDNKLILVSMQVEKAPKIYCFDTNTGKNLWATNQPMGYIENVQPAISNDKIFVGTAQDKKDTGGHIAALDINTGKIVWDKEFKEPEKIFHQNQIWNIRNRSVVSVKDDLVYVGLDKGSGTGSLRIFKADNGYEVLRTTDIIKPGVWGPFLFDEKYYYSLNFDKSIMKLNKNTCKIKWESPTGPWFGYLRFQSPEYIAYAIKEEGENKLVFLSKKDGQKLAEYKLPSRGETWQMAHIDSVVPIDDKYILVGIGDSTFYLLEGAQ